MQQSITEKKFINILIDTQIIITFNYKYTVLSMLQEFTKMILENADNRFKVRLTYHSFS